MKHVKRRVAVRVRGAFRSLGVGVAKLLPRPKGRGTPFPRRDVSRVVIFGRLPNPTIDYYLLARLRALGNLPCSIVDIRDEALAATHAEGTLVIICRYASTHLVTWIERHQAELAGVVLFTDDDMAAVITGAEVKLGYRLFLYYRALTPLRRLNPHIDVVWTSTPALARAIADPRAVVLPPAPPEELWHREETESAEEDDPRPLIVYHATAVHRSEHRFLRPVVEAILAARPDVRFEVTADERSARLWADLEGVEIVPPSSWESYLERTRRQKVSVVLVPLMRSRANETRADTKRIDVVRLGAAGIFSISSAYGEPDDSGELRLSNRRKLWIETTLALLDDAELRRGVAEASRLLVENSCRLAADGLPGLTPSMSQHLGRNDPPAHSGTAVATQTLGLAAFRDVEEPAFDVGPRATWWVDRHL